MSDQDKNMEIPVLRHQIGVLERQLGADTRVRFAPEDRVKGVNTPFTVVSCGFLSASWSEQWPGSGMIEARDAPFLLYDLLPHRGLADAAAP
jgi:hypothetical protein